MRTNPMTEFITSIMPEWTGHDCTFEAFEPNVTEKFTGYTHEGVAEVSPVLVIKGYTCECGEYAESSKAWPVEARGWSLGRLTAVMAGYMNIDGDCIC